MKTRIKNLLLLLFLLALPAVVQAQFTFTTNNDGSLNIYQYTGSGGAVTIPSTTNGLTVTTIGASAFAGSSLTSVTIPDSVTSIGPAAFQECSSLSSVTIPNSVTFIGASAFKQTALTSVTIPDSVPIIGLAAFADCSSLTNVTIENGVTIIGTGAFDYCTSLTSVTIPASVTSIWTDAFEDCTSLTRVYFTGNAPSPTNDSTVFSGYPNGDPATVYYLPGTTGWGALFDGRPTAPWFLPNPQILNNGPGFGVQPGGFGFTISWATNASVVVQAATNLAKPIWIPVATNTLVNGTNYFSDPQWTNYSARFYRVRSTPTFPGFTGNLDVDMYNAAVADGTANGGVPAVMLTENGGPFRVTADGRYSNSVARYYSGSGQCVFTQIVGTGSCSSTTLPAGTPVIQFGGLLQCGDPSYGY